jgi:DNA polymerase-1
MDTVEIAHAIGKGLAGDGMLAQYVFADVDRLGMPKPKGLKWLSEEYLGIHQPSFKDMLASAGVDNIWDIPVDIIGRYCCGDAFLGIEIERLLADKLVDMGLDKIYRQLELPNVVLLAEMELLGLPIDLPAAKARKKQYAERKVQYRELLETAAHDAGWSKTESKAHHGKKRKPIKDCKECDDKGRIQVPVKFNPGSRHHVTQLLQGAFKLPMLKAGSDGPSNDKLVLLQLQQQATDEDVKLVLGLLLAERRTTKLLGTYLEPLSKAVPAKFNGHTVYLIHPRYNQAVTMSNRLSSEDPNAQNQPMSMRDLYLAPPGFYFWDADYSQLELRIMAKVSNCTSMIEAFQSGVDIHALTGWRVFGISPKDLTPVMRVRCKTLNFGVGYEATAEGIHKQILKAALEYPELHIVVPDLKECQHLINEFWKAYPEVKDCRDFIHQLVYERGYSETIYGWRRNLPHVYIPSLRAEAFRQGWNLVIQGTAAQIMKNAELLVGREAPLYDADLRSQVHDELLGLVTGRRAEAWLERVVRLMKLDQPISPVPLEVSAHVGKTWLEAK